MSKKGSKPKKKSKNQSAAPINLTKGEPAKPERKSTFEDELAWCLSQLELGCSRKGATREQKEYNQQMARKLMSDKIVLPKKRLIMKNVFGDYRSKMVADPLPSPKEPRFVLGDKSSPQPPLGNFYRLAASEECTRKEGARSTPVEDDVTELPCQKTHSNSSNFKFSFVIES